MNNNEVLKEKIDFALLISVKNANPNGDPLNGNRPRVNFDGLGEISDVCLKRKIRNYLINNNENEKYKIFVQSNDNKTDNASSLEKRYQIVSKEWNSQNENEEIKNVCKEWLDVRSFGQVFTFKKSDNDKNNSVFSVRGPVTIQSAFTTKEVVVTTIQITKSVNGKEGEAKASDTMGTKHRIDYGLYYTCGAISPQLASITGFTNYDAELIRDAILNMFEGDGSSSRPEGSIFVKQLVWIKHKSQKGFMSSALIQKNLTVKDGEIIISQELQKLKEEGKIEITIQ